MSRNCEDYQGYLKDDLVGELDSSLRGELEAHLGNCRLCQKERDELAKVREALAGVEEVSVPHHFFVYQPASLSFLQLLRQLNRGWKAGLAVACSLVVAICTLALSQAHLSVDSGSFALRFGSPANEVLDSEAFKAEIVDAIKEASAEEDQRWVDQLRADWEASLETVSGQQQQFTQDLLESVEARLDSRAQSREAALSQELTGVMVRLHRASIAQYEADLNGVHRRLNRLATNERKANAVMSSLVQIADRQ